MWLKFRGLSVVIYSSSTAAAADEGLTREVHGLQPWCLLGVLPAGSQGQGNFPAVWAAPGHDHISHNAQKHFHHLPPTPQPPPTLPSLSPRLFSARSSLSLRVPSTFPIPFPPLPSPCLLEIHPHNDRSQFLLTFGAPAFPVQALEADTLPN